MTAMIDTLKFAKNFETAGFAKPQAEAPTAAMPEMTSLVREDLVTRNDLRVALAELKVDLKGDIAGLRTEMVSINAASQTRILWAMFGSQLFVLATVVALSKFGHLFA